MEARAIARFVRYAPRKVNQVLTVIRNQRVDKAFEILSFLPKNATELVEKVLKSFRLQEKNISLNNNCYR